MVKNNHLVESFPVVLCHEPEYTEQWPAEIVEVGVARIRILADHTALISIWTYATINTVISNNKKPAIERVHTHSLTFRVRRYVVTATKPVHRLQIRPIVHN